MYVSSPLKDPILRSLMIELETKALQLLRAEFGSQNPSLRDELLFAVVQVSAQVEDAILVPNGGRIAAFRPYLTTLQNLHIASLNLAYDTPHRSALRRLVSKKGGMKKVTMHGLAEYLNLYVCGRRTLAVGK